MICFRNPSRPIPSPPCCSARASRPASAPASSTSSPHRPVRRWRGDFDEHDFFRPPGAASETVGCEIALGLPSYSSTPGPSGTVVSCTTPEFATAAGALGFRSGVALVTSDLGDSVYLFGGNRTGSTTPSSNGFKNDLWQETISVGCNPGGTAAFPCPVGTTAQTKVAWASVAVAASPLPSPRANAGLAFADYRRLTVYGGTDATGNTLRDAWELDLSVLPATTQRRQPQLGPTPPPPPAEGEQLPLLRNDQAL